MWGAGAPFVWVALLSRANMRCGGERGLVPIPKLSAVLQMVPSAAAAFLGPPPPLWASLDAGPCASRALLSCLCAWCRPACGLLWGLGCPCLWGGSGGRAPSAHNAPARKGAAVPQPSSYAGACRRDTAPCFHLFLAAHLCLGLCLSQVAPAWPGRLLFVAEFCSLPSGRVRHRPHSPLLSAGRCPSGLPASQVLVHF